MLECEIRPMRPIEQSAVRALILDGLAEHFGVLNPALNPDVDDVFHWYLQAGHIFLTAWQNEQLIGTGGLLCQPDGVGQIVRVSVHRDFRRHGLGRRIVDALLRSAAERGLTHVWMETNDDWFAAIALYQSCGFYPFDRRDGNLYMRRTIDHTLIRSPANELCAGAAVEDRSR